MITDELWGFLWGTIAGWMVTYYFPRKDKKRYYTFCKTCFKKIYISLKKKDVIPTTKFYLTCPWHHTNEYEGSDVSLTDTGK